MNIGLQVSSKSQSRSPEEEDVLPGLGVPDDDEDDVERTDDGPPEEPHAGAVGDLTEIFLHELSIKHTGHSSTQTLTLYVLGLSHTAVFSLIISNLSNLTQSN